MAGFSDTVETAILNAVLRGVPYNSPAAVHVSLHSADPGDTGANEIAAGANAYARKVITFDAPATSGTAKRVTSSVALTWANLPAVTLTHFTIWDALAAGTPIVSGPLLSPKQIDAGDTFDVAAGDLTVDLD